MSVEPNPACGDEAPLRDAAATGATPPPADTNSKGHGEAVERELENWKGFLAGTDRDEQSGAMVLVLHRDFADYDDLRQKLESVSGSLKIVLRPACRSRKEIDDARRVIEGRAWHPQAKSVPMGWHFDARFSGFVVSIDESAPEVAKALEQRLGAIVRTRLENLSPHPNQGRARPKAAAPNR